MTHREAISELLDLHDYLKPQKCAIRLTNAVQMAIIALEREEKEQDDGK